MDGDNLPASARWLGYAGLLPQAIALLLAFRGGPLAYVAIAGGFAYAALIFSFLGGVWWGQAVANGRSGASVFIVAVLPSLISLALFLPWTFGWEWPAPQLIWLGFLIGTSLLVDRFIGVAGKDFIRLRTILSIGLGALTILLGLVAQNLV